MLTALVFLALAPAAPLPTAKERPPLAARIEGTWRMDWCGSPGWATLGRGGAWSAELGGRHYVGTWEVAGDVLTIRERCVGSTAESVYRVTLAGDQPRRGVRGLQAGGSFALE